MKRFFIFFFAILSALMGILLLTACAPAEHVHTWSKWQIHQQPTCTEKGVRDRSCECGEVQYGEIAANGHSAESYESDGMRHWSKCFFCHITLDEGECRYTAAALNSAIAIKKNYACAVCGIDSIYSGTFFFRENPDGESYEILLHSLCTQANIVIPETFNGKPVTHVGNFGSYPTSYLRSIKFPKTIVSVSDGFNGCSRLESVELNEGLESIGEYVFQMCYSLNEIIIPDSVTEIGAHAFQGCRSLQKLTLLLA